MYLFALLSCLLLSWTNAIIAPTEYPPRTERDLRHDLFQTYDKLVRPVKDPQNTIDVKVALTLISIHEVDEKYQNIVLETFLMMKWKDDFLTWNPQRYSNITILRLASSEIWKPDLALYTASPMDSMFPIANTQVLIYSEGNVTWVPMYTMKSRCPISKQADKRYIVCNLKMGSWTFNTLQLNPQLQSNEVDLSNFQDINPDWVLIDVQANRESKFYPCCPGEDYPNINFNVTLKRRPSKNEGHFMG